jgi:hypothetical protein
MGSNPCVLSGTAIGTHWTTGDDWAHVRRPVLSLANKASGPAGALGLARACRHINTTAYPVLTLESQGPAPNCSRLSLHITICYLAHLPWPLSSPLPPAAPVAKASSSSANFAFRLQMDPPCRNSRPFTTLDSAGPPIHQSQPPQVRSWPTTRLALFGGELFCFILDPPVPSG